MRFLFLGDIVGRAGRKIVSDQLPALRKKLRLDFVVANGENAASGFGLTDKTANQIFDAGVDVITGGNHSFDQKEIATSMTHNRRILRPANYPKGTPGHGHGLYDLPSGGKFLIINVMGRVFMNPLDCPFRTVDALLEEHRNQRDIKACLIDIHGEATSEKMAMGHFCDGRASLVVGTHSHIPTADLQLLPNGTAYQSDAGMCGDYNSVIGMDKNEPVRRFLTRMSQDRFEPASGPATLCGVFVETSPESGRVVRAAPVRIGPRLIPSLPE